MNDHRPTVRNTLVFGGYGSLGRAIADHLERAGDSVLRTSRSTREDDPTAIVTGPMGTVDTSSLPVLDAVVWAHGVNVNDSVTDLDPGTFRDLLETNVTLIAETLHDLVHGGRIADGARLVVLSSTWETVARAGKFSYTVSKAAIGGLVRAAAADLGSRGVLVNAVLPGIVETPMTRRSLTSRQIDAAAAATAVGRLVQPDDVASLVAYLCSAANTGITGQSISVDLGFSVGRSL